MAGPAVAVLDTSVLLNLATPVVDGRSRAPMGGDPLLTVLSVYDVHIPDTVLGEVSETASGDDLVATAADAVLKGAHHLTAHEIDRQRSDASDFGLDAGETQAIRVSNDLDADLFVTDEFNSTNYLLVDLALDDRNTLFTTPHVVCALAGRGILDTCYVDALLTYYVETKGWDRQYVERLRERYLHGEDNRMTGTRR